MRQSVVQNAGYAVDTNFGFGVLGHVGMGLMSWCPSRDGWSYPSGAGEQGAGEHEQVSMEQVQVSREQIEHVNREEVSREQVSMSR